jgi:hypothetical protein
VTVSYSRINSQGGLKTGAYQFLGNSVVISGEVTIKGLIAGTSYHLAIYSGQSGTPTFSVNGISQNTTSTTDWSSLVGGTHYVLFSTQVDSSGQISFVPQTQNKSLLSAWSAFQIQQSTPVPGPLPLLGASAAFGFSRRLRHRVSQGRSASQSSTSIGA